jgi:hypothetical protein
MTFAAIDWVLSLEPHYSSTMYGAAVMAGQGLGTIAMAIAVMVLLMKRKPMSDLITPGHLHDLGKLMLAATMFWAYLNFSQFLITWGGDLASEIPYYLRRTSGGWGWIGAALIAFHFFVPFGLLLNRDLKRNPNSLVTVAYWIIALRFFDICFLVLPSEYHNSFQGHMNLMAVLIAAISVVAIGGIWCYVFFLYLVKKPLMPVNDPYLMEALEFRGGH